MPGIFGTFSFSAGQVPTSVLEAMAQAIRHRGPGAMDYEADSHAALGHCGAANPVAGIPGDRPVRRDAGQVTLVQDGEIHNSAELRRALVSEGAVFDTTGDTEVLLRAYEHWGPGFVNRLNGMFAIAIHDRRRGSLFLYRDRLGGRPLYLAGGAPEGRLWFASEVKALLAAGVHAVPDYDAIAGFLALGYIPQPATAFAGVRHLPPGHMAEITPEGIEIRRYWDLGEIAPEPDMTPAEARSGLLALLDDATRIRMCSDAPFGAFLSGGVDSSSVVGFMSLYQSEPVRTFSIGFHDPRFDGTAHAQAAARRFGTLHEARVMDHDAASAWPRLIWHADQPYGDVSFMQTDQLGALAARDVKVVLSGDGADELFAGHDRYLALFPEGGTDHLTAGWEDRFVRNSGPLGKAGPGGLLTGALADAFSGTDPYRQLAAPILEANHQDPINRVLLAETMTLLPGNNLIKTDRMATAHALEVRAPFLDHRMAEFAFRMLGHLKLAGGETKAIYKHAVADLLGRQLTYRKKQTAPAGEWFRQTLAGFCREVLLDGRLAARGIVDTAAAGQMLDAHVAGQGNFNQQLSTLISLEIWFRLFIDRDPLWLDKAGASREVQKHGRQTERA